METSPEIPILRALTNYYEDSSLTLYKHIYSLYIHLFIIYFYPLSQKLAGYFASICWDVRQIYWISVKSKPYEEKGFQHWAGHRNSPEKVSSYSGSCVYPALDCFIGTLLSSILYSFQFCKKQTFRLLLLFNQTLRGGYSSLFANREQGDIRKWGQISNKCWFWIY